MALKDLMLSVPYLYSKTLLYLVSFLLFSALLLLLVPAAVVQNYPNLNEGWLD